MLQRLYRRITASLSRHLWELKSVSCLDFSIRKEFYIFYIIRFYLKFPLHFPFSTQKENPFFDLWDLVTFAPKLNRLSQFDHRLKEMIGEFYIKGVRAWEYGKFLSLVDMASSPRILDVGPGSSTFCYYLAAEGARVTTIDLPSPMEKRRTHNGGNKRVTDVYGTVTDLPFPVNTFDIVMAISTIEHLDTNYTTRRQIPYKLFLRRTKRSLQEMVRVLKKGGKLYITTDVFLPQQKTDRWKTNIKYKGIGGAYKFDDIRNVLLKTILKNGCKLVYDSKFARSKLISSIRYSNYRGRYITTIALFCEKVV